MYSKAKIAGHPIHPMLVAFPIVFYTLTLVAFAVFQFFSPDPFWYRLGYFANMAGVGTAVLAAIPGTIDWALGIPKNSAAKRRGFLHLTLNVGALLIFGVNAIRLAGTWNSPPDTVMGFLFLSFIGVVLTSIAGYHGWELISTHKVGVVLTPEQERIEPVEKMSREERGFSGKPRTV